MGFFFFPLFAPWYSQCAAFMLQPSTDDIMMREALPGKKNQADELIANWKKKFLKVMPNQFNFYSSQQSPCTLPVLCYIKKEETMLNVLKEMCQLCWPKFLLNYWLLRPIKRLLFNKLPKIQPPPISTVAMPVSNSSRVFIWVKAMFRMMGLDVIFPLISWCMRSLPTHQRFISSLIYPSRFQGTSSTH